MATKPPSKEIVRVNESITINRYSNGFMVEYSGQDAQNDYRTQKIVCTQQDQVVALLADLFGMPLAD